MKTLASVCLAIATYIIVSALLFGSFFGPLTFLMSSPIRLGAPYWPVGVVFGIVIASTVFRDPLNKHVGWIFRLPAFIACSLILSVLTIGVYVDWTRREAINAFVPEHVTQHSFFRSIREAPRDHQFFLHAAALKRCVPYAWSYRDMAFYALSPNVAVNVLPSKWIEMCSIKRLT